MARNPRSRIVIFCNEQEELTVAAKLGLEAVFMPQNAMCNENIFRPIPSDKKFDAIYNAKLDGWKRHLLARNIKKLALIYSSYGTGGEAYFDELQRKMPHASCLNGPLRKGEYITFNQKEIAQQLNHAKVGLCLSAVEGGIWASIEYLLSGLPVVSTPSVGGRSVFFDNAFCHIVTDDALSIEIAVKEMIESNPNVELIRERTLKKVHQFREFFVKFINREQRAAGQEQTGESDMARILVDWAGMKHRSIRELQTEHGKRMMHGASLSD